MLTEVYNQNRSRINGRAIWHYLIDTNIGQINIVDYEQRDMSIKRFIFDGKYDTAEAKYNKICKDMINGKI